MFRVTRRSYSPRIAAGLGFRRGLAMRGHGGCANRGEVRWKRDGVALPAHERDRERRRGEARSDARARTGSAARRGWPAGGAQGTGRRRRAGDRGASLRRQSRSAQGCRGGRVAQWRGRMVGADGPSCGATAAEETIVVVDREKWKNTGGERGPGIIYPKLRYRVKTKTGTLGSPLVPGVNPTGTLGNP